MVPLELLTLIPKVAARIVQEAKQAQENQAELLSLANRTQGVIDKQIHVLKTKFKGDQIENVQVALEQLNLALSSIEGLVIKWGQKRSKTWLLVDAALWRASKVKAEIRGAEECLTRALNDLMLSLQIHSSIITDELSEKFGEALQIV